ncbi:Stk1 family PASTA domain-containing Ser/Thr kinase [Fodinicola acaciae]|uniref:Stk1 family PASTA domain-containing Ser/Thr kinase n=1 Tax=Fodinicola acaciae TaxID=2681555 RepID=UPI0013D2F834|nr:Stk1 family PASTA domain-containing Ser/Thr kinase [Fodinicola acaciae]
MSETVVAEIQPGMVLDQRYQITGLIARGGMATVFHAVDNRLERTVAVKVMHPAYAADPSFVDRFVREALSIARLSHPNVVAVYDQGSFHGLAYLVMEYVPGRTLRQLLVERKRLTPAEAVAVLEPLLAGLAAAHRIDMVHRDVKPENVLIAPDGTVKVADFGLARVAEASAQTTKGVMMATVAYVAPEIVTAGHSDPRADVYATGIVLFEMLTGEPPFQGDSPVQVAYQHVHGEIPAPSERVDGVPPELDTLVLRATRREPGERPADAAAMLADLRGHADEVDTLRVGLAEPAANSAPTEPTRHDTLIYRPDDMPAGPTRPAYLRQRPVHEDPPPDLDEPPPPPPRRVPSRLRWWLLGAAALLLVLALAIGIGWWSTASRYTSVPQLTGLSKELAESRLRDTNLRVQYGTAAYDEKVPAGNVLTQRPAQGTRLERNSVVTLVLSKGPERHAVPSVVGKAQDTALQAIRNATLVPVTSMAWSDKVAAGRVISTDPKAGTKLRRGTDVKVVISKGPDPAQQLNNVVCSPLMRKLEKLLGGKSCKDDKNNDGNSGDGGDDSGN